VVLVLANLLPLFLLPLGEKRSKATVQVGGVEPGAI
jgi:hypothetical protein